MARPLNVIDIKLFGFSSEFEKTSPSFIKFLSKTKKFYIEHIKWTVRSLRAGELGHSYIPTYIKQNHKKPTV